MIERAKMQGSRQEMARCLQLRCILSMRSGCQGCYPKHLYKMLTAEATETLQVFKGEMEYADRSNEDFMRKQRKLMEATHLHFFDRVFADESKRITRMVTNACPSACPAISFEILPWLPCRCAPAAACQAQHSEPADPQRLLPRYGSKGNRNGRRGFAGAYHIRCRRLARITWHVSSGERV